MIKKLHYIKSDYSGNTEKFCLNTHKKFYPDFEFLAWKPGSSTLKILYDHGGLFIGPGFFSLNRIPDSCLEKPFLVFDNVFDSKKLSQNICCYSDVEKSPVFLNFMDKGIRIPFEEKTDSEPFKPCLNESDLLLDNLNIYNKNQFGCFDRFARKMYMGDAYICSTNTFTNPVSDYNLHYKIVNKSTDSNELFAICESFSKFKCDNENKQFLLLLLEIDGNRDLLNRMSDFLNYSVVDENKRWDIVIGNEDILTEYIGTHFDKLKSCEKI